MPSTAEKGFPVAIEPLLASMFELLKERGAAREIAILVNSDVHGHQVDYDNWKGGTYTWGLRVALEISSFSRLTEQERNEAATILGEVAMPFFADFSNDHFGRVSILPKAVKNAQWREQAVAKAAPKHPQRRFMPLQFPGDWKFAGSDEISAIPADLTRRFFDLLVDMAASSDDQWAEIERFKKRFGATARSTELSWAETDLSSAMRGRASNSVNFIESLWLSLEDAKTRGMKTPSASQINAWLVEHEVPFQITGDANLVRIRADASINSSPAEGRAPHAFLYQLGEVIGQGGFGIVHIATRETAAATFEYALKILDPSSFVDKEKAMLRFKREVRAIQSLQHRAIAPYVDAGIDFQGRPYMVMQYIKGVNIRDATEGWEASAIIALMAEVLHGLEHAHAHNVLHRDLKPSNILVRSSDKQPIIIDFGTAFIIDDHDTKSLTTAAVGSTGYIPHEVIIEPKLRTVLHDVYSCAVITYELISRRRPNPQEYVPLARQRDELVELDKVLIQALGPAKSRHATANSLRTALLAARPN